MKPIKDRLAPFGVCLSYRSHICSGFFEILEKQGDIFADNFLNIWPHLLSGKRMIKNAICFLLKLCANLIRISAASTSNSQLSLLKVVSGVQLHGIYKWQTSPTICVCRSSLLGEVGKWPQPSVGSHREEGDSACVCAPSTAAKAGGETRNLSDFLGGRNQNVIKSVQTSQA